jgi:hypothetical protein
MDNPRYAHTIFLSYVHFPILKKTSRCEVQLKSKSEASRDAKQNIKVEQEDDFVHLLISSIRNI